MTPTPTICRGPGGIVVPFDNFWTKTNFASIRANEVDSVSTTYGQGIQILDNVLSKEQLDRFLELTKCIEDVPTEEQDWRTDRPQMLDIVDPCLYLLTKDVSVIHEDEKSLNDVPLVLEAEYFESPAVYDLATSDFSKKYQLLPAEVLVDAETGKARITSYVNNLNPFKFGNAYSLIEDLIEKAIPLFEQALRVVTVSDQSPISLSGQKLQIIVGMFKTQLSPDCPKFIGTRWHTEGLRNERVVASAIFYLDVSNITESKLAFRVQTEEDEYKSQGFITAGDNRMVVFPNIYQHIVQPFELEDMMKEGHRNIVTIFLVDPGQRIVSTASVPPQQEGWYEDQPQLSSGGAENEFQNSVLELMKHGRPIGLKEAKDFKYEALYERRNGRSGGAGCRRN